MLTNIRYQLHGVTYPQATSTKSSTPIVMLGKTYIKGKHFGSKKTRDPHTHKFMTDFKQIAWVTYRDNFRPLFCNKKQEAILTDQGWGCTIRVCQMMLLTTLRRVSNSVWPDYQLLQSIQEYRLSAEYSLHRFVAEGLSMNKHAGQWYSPGDVCYALEKMVNSCNTRDITVKVFTDGVIYKDQLLEACQLEQSIVTSDLLQENLQSCITDSSFVVFGESRFSSRQSSYESAVFEDERPLEESEVEPTWDRPVLILLPLMLGMRKIERDYYPVVKEALLMPESVGIIGGRPRSALYFVGYQDDNLLMLDPHKVQDACTNEDDLKRKIGTYINDSARMISLEEVESSMALGFLITSTLGLMRFEAHLNSIRSEVSGLIQMQDKTPDFMKQSGFQDSELILE
mmetsp:Transcript_34448/g.60427  ORF Transcript_34448/g.60427 Transcript_34448/m.60427 type:complete len:399 (+) Transcript_34448:1124-2320(+)